MSDLNSVILIGRLTRDAEVRYMSNGNPVAGFTLAVGKQWKDQSGQKKEQTCFIDVSLFGKIVEVLKPYLVKGKQVMVQGELKQDTWNDKEAGKKQSKIGVNASNIQLLGGNEGGQRQEAPQGNCIAPQESFGGGNEGFQEDIPF